MSKIHATIGARRRGRQISGGPQFSQQGTRILDIYYFVLKAILLVGLARSVAANEAFQKQWLFFAFLYTGFLAALSWVFYLQMHPGIPPDAWKMWLVKSFALVAIYFKLLSRFDDGVLFWIIFLGGLCGLLWF